MGCAASSPSPRAFPSQPPQGRSRTHDEKAMGPEKCCRSNSLASQGTSSIASTDCADVSIASTTSAASSQTSDSLPGIEFLERAHDPGAPIRLVAFDFDETLTLATLLPRFGHDASEEKLARCVSTNFQSPWVEDRLSQLDQVLGNLVAEPLGCQLAVLTKSTAGARGVVRMLQAANLDRHFSAVWCMPLTGLSALRRNGQWEFFTPHAEEVPEHKPDVLRSVAKNPERWLPHLNAELSMDNIALVDDCAGNFQSSTTGLRVLHCCLVARHVGCLPGLGATQLGGLGARCAADFQALEDFIVSPWLHRA